MDRAFANEVDCLIEAAAADYSRMCYRDGIHRAWFDMIIVRDFYRCDKNVEFVICALCFV